MDKIAIVSCAKNKRTGIRPARDLYNSPLFNSIKDYLNSKNIDWWILSAKYGLIHNRTVISDYDATLNTMVKSERLMWFKSLVEPRIPVADRYIIFGGNKYREFLVPYLRQNNKLVSIPLESLGIGKQVQAMKNFKVLGLDK
jgi:hypothetical protein